MSLKHLDMRKLVLALIQSLPDFANVGKFLVYYLNRKLPYLRVYLVLYTWDAPIQWRLLEHMQVLPGASEWFLASRPEHLDGLLHYWPGILMPIKYDLRKQ